jgi:orotidine-5'-phosphate decarboxylase
MVSEVILALDVPSREDALNLVDSIPEARWVKVGPVLLTGTGMAFVRELVDRGLQVFLDLKWHDIPHTVAGAVARAADLGVAMATVHTLGGPEMMAAAAEAAGSVSVVGVTVLTSHTSKEWAQTLGRADGPLGGEVTRLTVLGREAGLDGVVCSPHEIGLVMEVLERGSLIVTPGIRRADDAAGDQARVATPEAAAAAGASHLVVGRPVILASDPRTAFRAIQEEARCGH